MNVSKYVVYTAFCSCVLVPTCTYTVPNCISFLGSINLMMMRVECHVSVIQDCCALASSTAAALQYMLLHFYLGLLSPDRAK